jgi:hypothetical protein
MVFMSENVRTGSMGGLKDGENEGSFGSVEDTINRLNVAA